MEFSIRLGRPEDAERAGVICYQAFKAISEQHRFPPDFPAVEPAVGLLTALLKRDDVHAVVAEREGQVLGSNFLWETAVIAGVGPITVAPQAQNANIGRALMKAVLERAQRKHYVGVRLVQSAYHSRSLSLYSKLGFDVREPLSLMQGELPRRALAGYPVRPAAAGDLADCNTVCQRVHGFDRSSEVAEAIAQGTASVVERNSRITGYATAIGFFGHAAAESNDDLKSLIGAERAIAGPGFLLPTRNGEVLRWCLAQGLRVVQPMSLMSLGLYNDPQGAFLPTILL